MRALALSAAIVVIASSAHAEEVTRARVRITIASEDAPAKAIEGSVRELLEQVDVELEVGRSDAIDPREVVLPPATFDKAVRVWIDLHGTTARVYLADAAWERVLVRTVPMPKGPDEIVREQIAHIVAGSIEALMAGATIGVGREDARVSLGVEKPAPPKPTPKPSPSPSPSPSPNPNTITSRATIGYEASLYAPTVLSHALGLWADVQAKPWWVAAGVLFRAPIVIDRDPIGVRLDTIGLRALAGGAWPVTPSLSLRSGVGGGVDFLRIDPRVRGGQNTTSEPITTSVVPILRATVALDLKLSASSVASFGLVADAELTARRFIVLVDGRPEGVVSPYRVRPGIVLSITSQLW